MGADTADEKADGVANVGMVVDSGEGSTVVGTVATGDSTVTAQTESTSVVIDATGETKEPQGSTVENTNGDTSLVQATTVQATSVQATAALASTIPATVSAAEGTAASSAAPKGKLADRLKGRGMEMPSAAAANKASVPLTAASLASLPSTGAHSPLAVSSIEQKQIFTPLAQQGARALEEQKRRKEEAEQELLQSVRVTLKKWVQECLSSDEKQQKMREKGVLKCRVKARWSEGLDRKLKDLVASYGGKLAADGEKDGSSRAPAWATAAELRTEKWMVGFDAPAFEKFMRAHPETVDPPDTHVKEFVKTFIGNADLQTMKVKALFDAMQTKFGHLRRPLLDRAKGMASDEITALQERLARVNAKKKSDADPASLEILKNIKAANGKGDKKKKATKKEVISIVRAEDVLWAEATLAPLGMRADSDEPIVRSPGPVAVPILEGLKAFKDTTDFRELLRTTKIGKVVNAFRHHPNSEVNKIAKEVVNGWKEALTSTVGQKKPPGQRRLKENPSGSGDGTDGPKKKSQEDSAASTSTPNIEMGDNATADASQGPVSDVAMGSASADADDGSIAASKDDGGDVAVENPIESVACAGIADENFVLDETAGGSSGSLVAKEDVSRSTDAVIAGDVVEANTTSTSVDGAEGAVATAQSTVVDA